MRRSKRWWTQRRKASVNSGTNDNGSARKRMQPLAYT